MNFTEQLEVEPQGSFTYGKSVKTIYRHIVTGKLSSSQNDNGSKSVDISELQRVYGSVKIKNENVMNSQMSELENRNDNQVSQLLQQENEMLKKLLDEKENHISSLKQAMLLLEHKDIKSNTSTSWFFRFFKK